MKDTIITGLETGKRIIVEGERVVRHLGKDMGIYATPMLITDIERLCNVFLLEHLDEGEASVGTHVDIRHKASTPEGMWVDIQARVVEVDRRAITFDVIARDAVDEVASCMHTRFIVDLDRVKEKITAKITKCREIMSG